MLGFYPLYVTVELALRYQCEINRIDLFPALRMLPSATLVLYAKTV